MADGTAQQNRSARRSRIVTAALLSLAVLGIGLLFFGLWAFVGPSTSTERKDFLQAVGGFFTGLAAIVGLYIQWKNARATPVSRPPESDQQPEAEQREFAEAQPQTIPENGPSESNQPTEARQKRTADQETADRLSRALSQLETKEIEVRLEALSALERILKESERHYWPIMQVLTAYVRQHAPIPDESWVTNKDVLTLEPDIQAIIDILRQHARSYSHGEPPNPLDLHETNLSQANLRGAHLRKVNLRGSMLVDVNFSEADLSEADLSEVVMPLSNLTAADLREANLSNAILGALQDKAGNKMLDAKGNRRLRTGADLSEANLRGANLFKAGLQFLKLERADLKGANLEGAHFWYSVLPGVNLEGAYLKGAEFWYVDLRGANLKRTFLEDASFVQADLEGANLEGALFDHLTHIRMGTNLRNTIGLSEEQLKEVTILDPDIQLPSHLRIEGDRNKGELLKIKRRDP
jgi:uncharacterized protein YjbI with pentapeptide repeats